jgi:copper transport protein
VKTCSSSSCRRLSSLAALLLALAFPAGAAAHARLVGSKPADGAVLATPPADVRLLFDDEVRPAGGDLAVDAAGRSVLAGHAHRLAGNNRALVIPLRPGLPRGAYTVRWRVISDDGHLITGVLAFAVGAGAPHPVPTLSAGGGGPSSSSVLLRLVFLAGVLVAGGAALTGRFLGAGRRLEALVVGGGLALVAAGGFGLLALEPAAEATRFGRVIEAAAIAGTAGAFAALGSLALPALGLADSAIGVLVLAAPTLAGHALDPHRLRWLVALADLAHVVAAAVWTGGLLVLVLVRSPRARRRFPPIALGAVVLLGVGAIPRAIAAFPSLDSVVDTGYGRAVLVKTGLLVLVLGVAWSNRRRLVRLPFVVELALLAGIVAAVAVLTDLRPPARGAVAVVAPAAPHAPPADAVVLAAEDDDVAIGLAASPRGRNVAVQVTALGPEGKGVDGLDVTVAGVGPARCGPGCYAATIPLPAPPRRVAVKVGGRTLVFTLPARWPAPAAAALVARVDRVFRGLRTLVIHERLASSSRNAITTAYRVQAPNRLSYRIVKGPEAVIIGGARWDRLPGRRWQRSEQEPLRQPEPFWGSDPRRNAHLLEQGRIIHASFYDPRLPAWFELSIDPRSGRLLALKMTATAHFMRHRYSRFDAPLEIVPPTPEHATQG